MTTAVMALRQTESAQSFTYNPWLANDLEASQFSDAELRSDAVESEANEDLEIQILTVLEECSEKDWDGYGALPVNKEAVKNLYNLLKSNSLSQVIPEVSADPDGDVSALWSTFDGNSFSISVNSAGKIYFALYLEAGPKLHGSLDLNDDYSILEEHLQRITNP